MYIGDTIRAEATVRSVHATKPIADIDFVITNQHGEAVFEGQAMVYQAAVEV